MKMSDSANAERNADAVRLSSRERPEKPRRYSGPSPSCAGCLEHLLLRASLRCARNHVGDHRHLTLAIEPPDFRGRGVRREAGHVVERHASEL